MNLFNKINTTVHGSGYAQSIDDFKLLGISQSYRENIVGMHDFS